MQINCQFTSERTTSVARNISFYSNKPSSNAGKFSVSEIFLHLLRISSFTKAVIDGLFALNIYSYDIYQSIPLEVLKERVKQTGSQWKKK